MIQYQTINDAGRILADRIALELGHDYDDMEAIVFVGALGICVRRIAPLVHDKYTDPAVVCVDTTGRYVIPVLSGHIGGANELARHIASVLGAQAVVTTQSDNTGLWALDTIAEDYGWVMKRPRRLVLNKAIASFVNRAPAALILETEDEGTKFMKQTCPEHVSIFRNYGDYRYHLRRNPSAAFEVLIAVTPKSLPKQEIPVIQYIPRCLHLGVGCQRMAPKEIATQLLEQIATAGYAPEAIATINSIELKRGEPLLAELKCLLPQAELCIHSADRLAQIDVPNPSEKVLEVTGCKGVAEASALAQDAPVRLVIDKQKGRYKHEGAFSHYTFALAMDDAGLRKGHIEIVGAGPGDPELVSVRGRKFLQQADLILYAGSLVPRQLTECHKPGAVVRSSANMDLEEQFSVMKEFYDKGKLVVRLHTGDPCIYGAIQEQMNFFDQYGMEYHITPGISSFLAAAAELRSQFTIPEKCQTIILTRGEGRTPMPDKEQLHLLAQHQSTMCIFLSASLARQVQQQLLDGGYPPETPVAACYKLTWPEQHIYRGQLKDLAAIIEDNHLTLTTMIVVGDSIDNREGLSRLYDGKFTHLFRKGKE